MKKLTTVLGGIFLFIIFNNQAFAQHYTKLDKEFNNFTGKQKYIICHAYKLGKPFNFGYTLAAIAWQESKAGKYLINLQDPSAGVFHNNLNTVMRRHADEWEDTPFGRNKIAQQLIDDVDFSAAEALAELEYWKSIHGAEQWMLIWASYNGGFNYDSKNPQLYARDISEKIKVLKKYLDNPYKTIPLNE